MPAEWKSEHREINGMEEIKVKAYAKLNLSLDIVSRLPDGYHAMRMVMQSVGLFDTIKIRPVPNGRIYARSDLRYLPCDDRNIAVRAARLLLAESGLEGQGVFIDMEKRIPVCAGLGGGSSDAAAVLRGLNELFGLGFTKVQLERLGAQVGSDVPFCVAGGTVLAEGKGERLTGLPPLTECHAVICKPAFSISTPELFSRIRCEKLKCRPDTQGMLAALEENDLRGVAQRCFNVFESVLPQRYAEISVIKSRLLDSGALGVSMSGTGSAVFGLFDDEAAAHMAREELKNDYRDCFLVKTVESMEI